MQVRLPELYKMSATDKLTLAYLQKLSRQNYIATASAALIVTFSLIWLIFQFGGYAGPAVTFFANSMYAVASLIGAYWACMTAYRARYGPLRLGPRHQLAWLLIGIGLFANGVGGIIYTYLEDYVQKNPVPSPADIGFTLCIYLCLHWLALYAHGVESSRIIYTYCSGCPDNNGLRPGSKLVFCN